MFLREALYTKRFFPIHMRAVNLMCNNDKMADVADEHEPTLMVPFNSMHSAMFKILVQHEPQHATFRDPLMPSNLTGKPKSDCLREQHNQAV